MLLAVVAIGANFWGFPVYILDEAKNAACAWEMFERGDWITPTFNGQLRTDKPPLHYFFMMTSYALFGVSAWSARLFSVVMGLLTVATVYHFTLRMKGERVAFYSGLTLVSSLFVILEFHLAVPDPYFIFFLTLSWLSFAYAWQTDKAGYYYLCYAATALAFLAKGPAAVVLSVAICGSFLIFRGGFRWADLRKVRLLSGILIFLLLAAPWWIAVTIKTGGAWTQGFIWEHNVGRFSAAYEEHGNFPGTAVLILLVAMLPLSVYLPRAMYQGWKNRVPDSLMFMSTLVVVMVLLFFSISRTLLPNYVGPAIPMAAILIGGAIDKHLSSYALSSGRMKWFVIAVAVLLSPLVVVLRSVIAEDKWINDLPGLAWVFLPWSLGAWMAAGFIWANRLKPALITALLSFWLVGVLFFYAGAPEMLSRNPVSKSLELVKGAQEEVIAYRFFNAAYVFNLQRTFVTFWDLNQLLEYSNGKPILVLTRDQDRKTLEDAGFTVIFEYPYLFEGSTALVFTNRVR